MAIDWDRLVVESEHNGVIASAGEVALLVGADAAGVTWGNITGDVTQQADLMALVDGFAPVDSPQFTGIPRTVTPPEGNNSTRIASTAFVEKELQRELTPYAKTADLGGLAYENTIDYTGNLLTNKPTLGSLAAQNYITTDNIQYEQYLFVDAAHGSDSNPGDNVNYPLKTIYAAIQKAKSPATTMIQIYPGTYTEMPTIRNKNIELYSLADNENSPVIIETPIYASKSTIYLSGIMKITGIQASGSTIFYFLRSSGSYLHTTSRIEVSSGSILNVFPGIYIDPETEINTTALEASSGSIITLGTVTWAHAPNPEPSIGTVMKADGGVIQYVDFDMSLRSYGTLKTESNNGRVVKIENFVFPEPSGGSGNYLRTNNATWKRAGELALENDVPNDPSAGAISYYIRTSDRTGAQQSCYWQEAGDMALGDDAPVNNSPFEVYYVRMTRMDGSRKEREWVDFDPPMDTSANVKRKWVRVHESSLYANGGDWEELDEPPASSHSESDPELYARAAYMVGTPPNHVFKYKWVKINL